MYFFGATILLLSLAATGWADEAADNCSFWLGKDAKFLDGRCVLFIQEKMNFLNAQKRCVCEGGTLAQILSDADFNYYSSRYTNTYIWFGATDDGHEGNWIWLNDNSKVTLSNSWMIPQGLDNVGGYENCLIIWEGGKLTDAQCNWELYFFCQRPKDKDCGC